MADLEAYFWERIPKADPVSEQLDMLVVVAAAVAVCFACQNDCVWLPLTSENLKILTQVNGQKILASQIHHLDCTKKETTEIVFAC